MADLSVFGIAEQCLQIRAAVLAAFGQPANDDLRLWDSIDAVGERAWEVFLDAEQYVAPLVSRLQQAGVLESLPAGVAAVLARRRRHETVRALRARAQLEEIGAAAQKSGWSVIVLKGGRAILEDASPAFPLFDLDLLVSPEHLTEFVGWLDSRRLSVSALPPPKHHLEVRYTDGALPIEAHRTIHGDGSAVPDHVWKGAVRLTDGLLGLSPVEHTWHVLHHATVSHVSRRGRLRDLELLSHALKTCSPSDRQELHKRTSVEHFADPLSAFLHMAEEAAAGESVTDRFELLAFTRYVTYCTIRRSRWHRPTARAASELVFAMQEGWKERKLAWQRGMDRRSPRAIVRSVIGKVDRLSPRLGGLLENSARRVYRAVLAVVAWFAARWIRRAWRRAAVQRISPDGLRT